MLSPRVVITQARNLIYVLLIFGVGVLAPLTISTPLSPHRDVPSVYIALFDSPPDFSFRSNASEPLVNQLKQAWGARRFNAATLHALESFVPSLVHFFQSNMSDGYLLTVARAYLLYQASLLGFIALYILTGRSAVLPPFEKPPQRLCA